MGAIELSGVTKRYGSVTALDDLDLTVERGEIYGFLGPNGAGKSTAINLLLDYARPDAGTVSVFGMDSTEEAVAIHGRTGLLPEGYALYDRLTAREHVEYMIDSKEAADDPDAILERVGIPDAADRRAGGFSTGMGQRLVLGMALVGEPDLLVLDEPTSGLDPNGARELRSIVRQERDRGATVFFSSHILSQVEAVCDRVGILTEGRLVAEDSPAALREEVDADTTIRITVDDASDEALAAARAVEGVQSARAEGDRIAVAYAGGSNMEVTAAIEDAGVTVTDVTTDEASLEDLFAAYTGGGRDGSGASTVEVER
jgi:ABC-2 type transport system ATP-binding protein